MSRNRGRAAQEAMEAPALPEHGIEQVAKWRAQLSDQRGRTSEQRTIAHPCLRHGLEEVGARLGNLEKHQPANANFTDDTVGAR